MPADSMATSVPAPMAMPDVGLGEGGCVVDPVADHCHFQALALEFGDLGVLVLGKHLGQHLVDPELSADRCRPPGGRRR
jgi:hypothetical protein